MKAKLKNIDYWIFIPFLLLAAIGIVLVYSASSNAAILQGLKSTTYLKRQLLFVIIGLLLCGFFYLLKIKYLRSTPFIQIFLISVFMALLWLLLLKHLKPSTAVNGAAAWIHLGPFNIQPLELAKLALVLYLAQVYSQRLLRIRQLSFRESMMEIIMPLFLTSIFVFMTLGQPDLGGAASLAAIMLILAFASGMDLKYVFGIVIVLLAIFVSGYFWFKNMSLTGQSSSSYQMRRLLSFYHPFQLEKAGGSQLVNSYYAINNGGLWGRGLGNSIQKLGYLPEPYTDFILAIACEELGIFGVIIILGLLFVLIARIVYLGLQSQSAYLSLLSYGIATILFVQSVFNVGGVLGVLPITGVTLPFISYGGSSILVLSACMGIMLNVSINIRLPQKFSH
ncbi:FtsW/RodA/SpoVE family cell cycle protein [Bombilactobacillus bombi]|uniref:FtsW/RodA/SpoVE family cell cycle protein n=1 Tax=Bombilactobacillus bombi TaxID=1303590 RepID=UPI0015E5DA1E|nr:putative peptidoglycan glycosyltransferase FtsW [Bombilactobacillus bombi]